MKKPTHKDYGTDHGIHSAMQAWARSQDKPHLIVNLPKPASDSGWIPCTSWDELPAGTWLVKIENDVKPYQVAEVTMRNNDPKSRLVVVGGQFSWDVGSPLAYTSFEPYDG